jgi:hypothetical protein
MAKAQEFRKKHFNFSSNEDPASAEVLYKLTKALEKLSTCLKTLEEIPHGLEEDIWGKTNLAYNINKSQVVNHSKFVISEYLLKKVAGKYRSPCKLDVEEPKNLK